MYPEESRTLDRCGPCDDVYVPGIGGDAFSSPGSGKAWLRHSLLARRKTHSSALAIVRVHVCVVEGVFVLYHRFIILYRLLYRLWACETVDFVHNNRSGLGV